MIETSAIVERVEGDQAWVRLRERAGGCGRCDEPGGCRSTGIAHALGTPTRTFRLRNAIGAQAGDTVRLRMHDGAPLRGAVLTYGLGAGMLLLGAAIGNATALAGQEDLPTFAGAATGLLAALAVNRLVLRSCGLRDGFHIEMVHESAPCAGEPREPQ